LKILKKSLTVNLIDTLYFKGNNNFAAGGHGLEVLVKRQNLWAKKKLNRFPE
jgi:hypothetical protein